MIPFPRLIFSTVAAGMLSLLAGTASSRAAVLFSSYTPGDSATYQLGVPYTIDYATSFSEFGEFYWHFDSFEWIVYETVTPTSFTLPALVNQVSSTNITLEIRTDNGPFKGSSVAVGTVPSINHQSGSFEEYVGSITASGPISPGTYYVLLEYYSSAVGSGSVDLYASNLPANGKAFATDYYPSLSPGYVPATRDNLPAIRIEGVPEPASATLLILGGVILMSRRRSDHRA